MVAVRAVHWANPAHDDEDVVRWIEAWLPDDANRQLGQFGTTAREGR